MTRQKSDPSEVRGGSLGPLFDGVQQDYHNTVGLKGDELRQRTETATAQTDRVYAYFKAHPLECIAPHEVHAALFPEAVPLTSTRRAITDLTTAGLLVKTEVMVRGPYGDPVHCWRLRRNVTP